MEIRGGAEAFSLASLMTDTILVRTLGGELFTFPYGYDLRCIREHLANAWEIDPETVHLSSLVPETVHLSLVPPPADVDSKEAAEAAAEEYFAYIEDRRDYTLYYEEVTLPSRMLAATTSGVSAHSGPMQIIVVHSADRSLEVPVQIFSSPFILSRQLFLASTDPAVQLKNYMGEPYSDLESCVRAYYAARPPTEVGGEGWRRFLPRLPMANLVLLHIRPLLANYDLAQIFRNRRMYLAIVRVFQQIGGKLYQDHLAGRLDFRAYTRHCGDPLTECGRLLQEIDGLPDGDHYVTYAHYSNSYRYWGPIHPTRHL